MKRVTTDLEIAEKIYKRRKEVIENIDQESIDVYLWLKDAHEKGNIKNNFIFQFVFRSYYGLDRAGLSKAQKKKFFELLVKKETDLRIILRKLSELPNRQNQNTVQFSFATKLLHTIDDSKPIFDAKVSVVVHKAVTGSSVEEKIESAEKLYNDLENLYLGLIENEKVREVIKGFKSRFGLGPKNMTEQKILDFIIWSLGSLLVKKIKK